jgi:hypothetical protein
MGGKWRQGLLPFCEWGCNTFSCVDCYDASFPVYLRDEERVLPQQPSFEHFITAWLDGAKLMAGGTMASATLANPFTKREDRVHRRRW